MPIMRMPAVRTSFGFGSPTSIYAAIHGGLLTHPVRIGARAVGWPSEEVDAIIAARIAGQPEDQIRELVVKLHMARCSNTGETFKPTWLDKSADFRVRAGNRKKRRVSSPTSCGIRRPF